MSSSASESAVTTPEEEIAEPVPEPEAVDAGEVAGEPYVVECLFGTPGPALWSDGTTDFSQECFDELTADRGDYVCPQTDHFVHDPSECQRPEGWEGPYYVDVVPGSESYDPDFYHEDGTARTSGEIQLRNGCEDGYITGPECDAL